MALVSMKKEPDNEPMEAGLTEDYGYGLCLSLDEDQCNALGITTLPEPGKTVMIRAKCTVVRTMIENDGEGPENHMTLQVTDMELGAVEGNADKASMLYAD
jgi:hypothetical protein